MRRIEQTRNQKVTFPRERSLRLFDSKRQLTASGAPAAASDPEALTGSDPAAPHFRFVRRASKCSSAGLDIGPLPRPPGACPPDSMRRTRPVHAPARATRDARDWVPIVPRRRGVSLG